jgi:nitrate/nitrite-specific signal transduction histidine kinase
LWWEIYSYTLAGTLGGLAGAGVRYILYSWLRAEENIVYEVQEAVTAARNAADAAKILGCSFSEAVVGVALYVDCMLDATGVWVAPERGFRADDLLKGISERSLHLDSPWQASKVTENGKVLTVFVVPMKTAESSHGALVVWFSHRFEGRVRRRFILTAPVVGLALRVREHEHRLTMMEDQRRFARMMHDGCKQDILGAELHLSLVRQHLEEDKTEDALENLKFAKDGIQRAREEINALVREFRLASTKTARHLSNQLYELGKRIERESGLRVQIDAEGSLEQVSSIMAEELVWVTREAIANIVKHARATEARIHLLRAGSTVALEIRDNGIGFDPAAATTRKGGYGLTTMRERTEELGGTLLVDSSPDSGTSVLVVVPTSEG